MGKFDGVLLVSDFDDTMVDTSSLYRDPQHRLPPLPAYSVERLRYFMDNGGRFCVVTGRSWQIMRPFIDRVPTNGPCAVANGAGIIDIQTEEFLYRRFLPPEAIGHLEEVMARFPDLTCELFRADHKADVIHPIPFTVEHAEGAKYTYRVIENPRETEAEVIKILFEGEPEDLEAIGAYIRSRPWFVGYELAFSGRHLMEMTALGANKGEVTKKLMELLGASPEHLYCAGDQENDLPMLRIGRESFAPANAIPAVLRSGVTVVRSCGEGAIGEVVDHLDRRYS